MLTIFGPRSEFTAERKFYGAVQRAVRANNNANLLTVQKNTSNVTVSG